MLEIEPVSYVVRWFYDNEEIIARRTKYRAVCSMFKLEPHHAYIYAMHGQLNKKDMKELFEILLTMNITKITAERKGRLITRDVKHLLEKDNR